MRPSCGTLSFPCLVPTLSILKSASIVKFLGNPVRLGVSTMLLLESLSCCFLRLTAVDSPRRLPEEPES